jgi:WD40 repeat protein
MVLSRIHSAEISISNEKLFNALAVEIDSLIANKKLPEALRRLEEFRKLKSFGNNRSYYEIIKKLSTYCIQKNNIYDDLRLEITEPNVDLHLQGHSYGFSSDGSKVLCAVGQSITLWDTNTGNIIHTFHVDMSYINFICFSPNEHMILLGGYGGEHQLAKLQLWNTNTCQYICSFDGHKKEIMTACFHPDGTKVLSGSQDETVKLWDIATGNCIRTFEGHEHNVVSVSFHPDGSKILSASSDNTVKLWDIVTEECIHTFIFGYVNKKSAGWNVEKNCMAYFSPDGHKILSIGGHDAIIKLWDASSGECVHIFEGKKGLYAAYSPDGRKLLIRQPNYKDIEIWDMVHIGDCIHSFKGCPDWLTSFCFSSNGMRIILASYSDIRVYDLEYDLTFPGWHDWDEGARPYLDIFLTLHPNWTEDDFNNILIPDLQNRGYGWLRPEGVRIKLDELQFGW